ncbi:MAG: hypothetical protein H0U23_15725 [Blastocatellia bacterium]|nr:hypothetical protein [Blastocatellia bacterium]
MKPGGSVDNTPLAPTFGLLQTAFSVDPQTTAGVWWRQTYNQAPDIALNHPNRWKVEVQPDSSGSRPSNCLQLGTGRPSQMNCAELAKSLPDNPFGDSFHDMRGFFISNITNGNLPGQGPQIETAKAGDKLALQARVYNYSLKRMKDDAKVHVRFYGTELNNVRKPDGDSFFIGEDVIGPISPFDSKSDKLNWVLATTTFDTTPYADKHLAFWVVVWSEEANGTLTAELPEHGLKAIPSTLKNLADASFLEADYSNNVGFYKSAFYVYKPATSNRLGATNGGNVRLSNVQVSDKKIQLGDSVEVTASLSAPAAAASGVSVIFYDGDPQKGGKAFDIERVPHVRAGDTYQVKVPFKPQSCGAHQVFATATGGQTSKVRGSTGMVVVRCKKTQMSDENAIAIR